VRVAVDLRGVPQVVVDVKVDRSEYGEVGADLPQPCSRSPQAPTEPPVPVPSPLPASASPSRATAPSPAATLVPPPASSSASPVAAAPQPSQPAADRSPWPYLALGALCLVALGAAVRYRRRRP
jgi:hypothetical protein